MKIETCSHGIIKYCKHKGITIIYNIINKEVNFSFCGKKISNYKITETHNSSEDIVKNAKLDDTFVVVVKNLIS